MRLQPLETLRYKHKEAKPCTIHESHLLHIHNEVPATCLFRLLDGRLEDGLIGIGQVSLQVQDDSLRRNAFFDFHDNILSSTD